MLNFEDIDNGTKLRTAFAVLVAINQAIALTPIPDFGNEYANLAYRVISTVISIAVLALNTYYNNDYTSEGQIGTVATHTLKDDPTAIVEIYDGDEDEEEEEPITDTPDETIEEGDE